MARGLEHLPSGCVRTSTNTAVLPVDGTRDNEVLWWHHCGPEGGWVASGLAAHTLTGAVADGSLTIRASLLCEACGKHGFLTDMRFEDC